MVESVELVRVVHKDQAEQLRLILLCVLPISYPPSFFKSIIKVSIATRSRSN